MQKQESKVDLGKALDVVWLSKKAVGQELERLIQAACQGMMQILIMHISNLYMTKSQWLRKVIRLLHEQGTLINVQKKQSIDLSALDLSALDLSTDTTQLNIQTTPETTTPESTVIATENVIQAENVMVNEDEFFNIFSTPVHEVGCDTHDLGSVEEKLDINLLIKEKSDSDLESTARSGPRDNEMEDTGGSGIQIND
ncbi:hypothetical protein Tco_0954565 [Tanacetum coccineum]|uniref:Uncharacterized protein n=1 Tax=Tanacetum coccineum TaxID=301880 RepID=A0ABQ5E4S0_9ASTR